VPESLSGRHFALARLVYYRQTGGKLSQIFDLPLYFGASLEAGNVWLDRDRAGVDDLVTAGSLFVGLDTFLGPIYLAYGRTDAGEDRWYFALGAPF
jgi:NTE family protein